MYSNFVFLDQFLFELSCKKTHTQTHTHTHAHTDSNEYPIVVFSKNATVTKRGFQKNKYLFTNSTVFILDLYICDATCQNQALVAKTGS